MRIKRVSVPASESVRVGRNAHIRNFHSGSGEFAGVAYGERGEQRGHGIHRAFRIPVWNVLEQGEAKLRLTLINPQHVHALPGRKTDRKDGQRIAELMQYGLLKGSFIAPPEIRELRDLSRRRTHLQGERDRVINRIRRLLETANIKLGSVVSDITGKTASLILDEICRDNCTPNWPNWRRRA